MNPSADSTVLGNGAETLLLTSPAPLTVYQIATTLPAENQRIPVEAVGPEGLASITLWIDGQRIATLDSPPYRAWWQLSPGRHEAWAEAMMVDGKRISSAKVTFEVKGP